MFFSVSVDAKGRIILPSGIRKTLGFNTGDKLELALSVSEGKIIIRMDKYGI